MHIQTTIKGYAITVEDETAETIQCWIERGGHTSSLACLQASGELTNRSGWGHSVHLDAIDLITEWAEENGY